MPSGATLAAFAAAVIVLVAVPRPNMLFLVARSISDGRRVGVRSALGIELGTCVHIAAAAAGLSALLASSATAFAVVKYAGAAYLVLLGVRALTGRVVPVPDASTAPAGRHVLREAMLVQLLNPKVAIFFLAFLPQFVDPGRPAAAQVVVLGAVLIALGLTFGVAIALAAGSLSRRVRARRPGETRPWGRWASGCVYLGLGAYTALGPGQRAR